MNKNRDQLLEKCISLYGEPDRSLIFKYSAIFLSKKNFKENDIFKIHAKINGDSKRIGWIFPLLVLGSSEYDLFGDTHFEQYIKIGASYLAHHGSDVAIDDNTHILILKDETLIDGEFYIHDCIMSLLKYGYYNISFGVAANNKLFALNYIETKRINVAKSLPVTSYTAYVKKLLCELLPKVEDPLSRFVSIYQVVELLIEKYFHFKLDEHKMRRSTIGTIRDNMAEFSSERKLINGVFGHCAHRSVLNENEISLVRVLFGSDKDEVYYKDLNLPNFVYDIRNAIFHNYHKYELNDLMRDIAERMEYILAELLENPKISILLSNEYG
ncbi:hypothetical protein [Janthinobacterium sp. P210006]|uniref:hypothetical protein n=1 Tax=Janthinobacterium sp. P210006 TaxID=3112939 RepID=UPI002E26EFD9|nr:hypothetical protein [Janthinobacterium sp. P210006]